MAYALYDNEIRKRIEEQVPYAKDVFEKVFSYLPPPKDANRYIVFYT